MQILSTLYANPVGPGSVISSILVAFWMPSLHFASAGGGLTDFMVIKMMIVRINYLKNKLKVKH